MESDTLEMHLDEITYRVWGKKRIETSGCTYVKTEEDASGKVERLDAESITEPLILDVRQARTL